MNDVTASASYQLFITGLLLVILIMMIDPGDDLFVVRPNSFL